MNPRVSRSLRAGLEGHRLPDRQDRRAAGGGLRARGDRQRHHAQVTPASFEPTIDYVVVKWPRFAFEKFPGADGAPLHPHEVGGRGDGDRAHLQAGVREGDALARARRERAAARGRRASCSRGSRRPSHDRYELLFEAVRRGRQRGRDLRGARAIDPWFVAELAALARGEDPEAGLGAHASRRSTPAPPSSRPRRPTTTRAGSAADGARHEVRRGDRPSVVILGSGPEPHRPGHRVRLLLRARRDDRARARAATR